MTVYRIYEAQQHVHMATNTPTMLCALSTLPFIPLCICQQVLCVVYMYIFSRIVIIIIIRSGRSCIFKHIIIVSHM